MKIQLIKADGPSSSPVSSKISAIESKRFRAQVRNNNRTASRVALWRYLHDHGEDMRKWHDQNTPVLRARVRELQNRPTTSVVAPVTTGNEQRGPDPSQRREMDNSVLDYVHLKAWHIRTTEI